MRSAIVTCVTSNWLPWACVTMLSAYTSGQAKHSDLYIFVHNLEVKDHEAAKAFMEKHGLSLKIESVDGTKITTGSLGKWGVGAVIRLALDRLLPRDYERVLYLDSDVLVLNSLTPLLGADLKGCTLGAVSDIGTLYFIRPRNFRRKLALGFDEPASYFNSGVLLLDWQKTLAENLLPQCVDLLNRRKGLESPDQDALNLVVKGRWAKLDYRWNVLDIGRVYIDEEAFIVHFTGRKPWSSMRRTWDARFHAYYRESLAGTPWAGRVDQHRSPKLIVAETTAFWARFMRPTKRKKLAAFIRQNTDDSSSAPVQDAS